MHRAGRAVAAARGLNVRPGTPRPRAGRPASRRARASPRPSCPDWSDQKWRWTDRLLPFRSRTSSPPGPCANRAARSSASSASRAAVSTQEFPWSSGALRWSGAPVMVGWSP